MTRGVQALLCALSGIILYFAMPRWSVEMCVWLWIYPLLAVLWLVERRYVIPTTPAGRIRRWWRALTPVRVPFLYGWLAGGAFMIPALRWVRHSPRVLAGALDNSWAGFEAEAGALGTWAAMSGFMSLYFGVWAVFMVHVARPRRGHLLTGTWLQISWESIRSAALAAAFWVVMEWARGIIITGLAWDGLGVGLMHNLVLVQTADILGIAGVSFMPVFVSCVVFNTLHRVVLHWHLSRISGPGVHRRYVEGTEPSVELLTLASTRRRFRLCLDTSAAVLLLALTAAYGLKKMAAKPETMPVKVACVQINEAQAKYWNAPQEEVSSMYGRYADLTRLYAENRQGGSASPVDLVIWPEGALYLPFGFKEHPRYFNDLLGLGDYSLLVGCSYQAPSGHPSYNSAALMYHDYSQAQLYHKVHLVPFGEYLPFRWFPPVNALLGGVVAGDFDFGPSTEPLWLAKPKVQVIPLICFEDTVGDLARQFVRDAPQFMANLSNDGWFLDSDEMEQQKASAVFRCIELRRPMVRATNTGVTCFIDERGVELSRLSDRDTGSTLIEGVLPGTVNVPVHPVMTFYALHGDVFSMACFALCIIAAGLRARRMGWFGGSKKPDPTQELFDRWQSIGLFDQRPRAVSVDAPT